VQNQRRHWSATSSSLCLSYFRGIRLICHNCRALTRQQHYRCRNPCGGDSTRNRQRYRPRPHRCRYCCAKGSFHGHKKMPEQALAFFCGDEELRQPSPRVTFSSHSFPADVPAQPTPDNGLPVPAASVFHYPANGHG